MKGAIVIIGTCVSLLFHWLYAKYFNKINVYIYCKIHYYQSFATSAQALQSHLFARFQCILVDLPMNAVLEMLAVALSTSAILI